MDFLFKRNGVPFILSVADDLEVTERPHTGNLDSVVSTNLTASTILSRRMMSMASRRQAEVLRSEGTDAAVTDTGLEIKKVSAKSSSITSFLLQVSTDPNYVPAAHRLRELASEIQAGLVELRKGSCPACQQNEFLRGFRARVGDILDAGGRP